MSPFQFQASMCWLAALLALATVSGRADGFSFCPTTSRRKAITFNNSQRRLSTATRIRNGGTTSSSQRSSLNMYLPPDTPTTQTAPMVSQRILSNPNHTGRKSVRGPSTTTMSNSVLASTDTLPSFPTAHGLLSPEIVQRMDEMTSARNQRQQKEIVRFLDTYRTDGPMACLPMLSDPGVLPKLTEAMRDIA